jgi:hypothetical protein
LAGARLANLIKDAMRFDEREDAALTVIYCNDAPVEHAEAVSPVLGGH